MTKINPGTGPHPALSQTPAGEAEFASLLKSATAGRPAAIAPATAPRLASKPPLLATRQVLLLEDILRQPHAPPSRPSPNLIRLVRRANQKAAARGDTALEMVQVRAEGGTLPFSDARVGSLIFLNDDMVTQWRGRPGSPTVPGLLERHIGDYLAET